MLFLRSSVLVLMLGFIVSVILGFIIIPLLKKLKASQSLSSYLDLAHSSKKGTPTMGGVIFIFGTLIVIYILSLFNMIDFSLNFLIVIFTFISYAFIGFLDDFLIIKRHNNKGLKEGEKFLLQIVVAVIFFYLFMRANNEPLLWIHFLNLKIDIGWFYGLFILLVLASSSNAVNISDGLDGLAGGLSFIAILAFAIITYFTGWLEGYESIALTCFALCGCILGFLVFNTHPAKVFMGDTGSLSLGAFLGAIAILTRREILLIIIGIVFVVETITCLIQRYYYKLTKKRLFPMTPIHHTFEKLGWCERDIVKLFWIIGLIGALIGIVVGVVI